MWSQHSRFAPQKVVLFAVVRANVASCVQAIRSIREHDIVHKITIKMNSE